jgi:hypothetical protein
MRGRIGCPTRIITPIPHVREPAKGETKKLPQKAKFRLKVFDWYYHKSALHSLSGIPGASLTCRYFGIHRSYFYRWKARCDKRRVSSLENRNCPSTKPAPALLPTGTYRESQADTEKRSNLPGKKDTPHSAAGGGQRPQRLSHREADKQGEPVFQG